MRVQAKGIAETKQWDEQPYQTFEGERKLTKASVTQHFTGDIEGEGAAEYLMVYPNAQSASYVGLLRINGKVGGKQGSFVLQLSGTYDGAIASGTWVVVPGAGTNELANLRGEGGFRAHMARRWRTRLTMILRR